MAKKNHTKKALISSLLALFICFTMLIGTTFAWFTDTAVSSGNKIQAGTLKIDLLVKDGDAYKSVKDSKEAIFNYDKWEPGYVEYKNVKVSTDGNLALKYTMSIVPKDKEASKLAEVIDVYYAASEVAKPATRDLSGLNKLGTLKEVLDGAAGMIIEDTLIPVPKDGDDENTEDFATIALKMQETAGNEYQGLAVGGVDSGFDLFIQATQYTYEEDSFDNQYDAAAIYADNPFAGGSGTAEDPYIVNAPSQLLSISSNYDKYKYYKVADGVETLDLTGVGKIKLNGSFDGNGVTMNNLSTALFQSVGTVGNAQDIKIANFTANVNTTDGNALVRNIYNPGTTTFENVTLHGYIEGQYNIGSFYNYGTANASGSEGADYTVSFVNAKSDATLVCTSGNVIGGMLGHGYEGADYKLSIKMDGASGYTGQMYTTTGNNCYQVMGMCSHHTYILNGVEVSRYENTYPSTKLTAMAPIAEADGYYVAPAANVDHYVVSLEAQLTAYDDNDVKIPNLAGLTWSLGKTTITSNFNDKIFGPVATGEIVNDADHPIGYELNNGALKVYSGRDIKYKSGWITLIVTQYDAGGNILATGNVRVYTFAEP